MIKRFSFVGVLIMALLLAACDNPTTSPPQAEVEVAKTQHEGQSEPIDYSLIDYKLPQSDYSYKVKITGIDTKSVKDAFTTKADDYSVPEKVDGYLLGITFSMTNPYDKEMMAPVPSYYYITSGNDEWFSASTTRHKDCHCDIDNSTKVTNDAGKELYEIAEGKCGYSDYCIRFQPKETKNFKINFTDPIISRVKTIAFWGFDRKWKNPDYTRDQDCGLMLDIDKKEITGEKKF